MNGELPPRVVADITFLGRGGGSVKTLGGFRKGHHTVPEAATSATVAFLARLCADDLAAEAEDLFQRVRAALGYKRREVSLSVASPSAVLAARDFTVELAYALDPADPARFTVLTTLRGLRDAAVARGEAFSGVFAGRFTEISFALAQGVSVEAVIDAVEDLDEGAGLAVHYPSHCQDCTLTVPGVAAAVRCSGGTLEVVFPRGASPAELIDAFALVRDRFQISQVLRALIR